MTARSDVVSFTGCEGRSPSHRCGILCGAANFFALCGKARVNKGAASCVAQALVGDQP